MGAARRRERRRRSSTSASPCSSRGSSGARLLHVFADGYFWDYVHLCTDPGQVELAARASRVPLGRLRRSVGRGPERLPPEGDRLLRLGEVLGGRAHVLRRLRRGLGRRLAPPEARRASRSGRRRTWRASPSRSGSRFGRMGCLLAGCCFGSDVRAALGDLLPLAQRRERGAVPRPPARAPKMWSLPVHPTQIYESAASLAIAAFCLLWVHAAQAVRRAGLRRVPRALRRRALPPRGAAPGRPGRPPRALDVAAHRARSARCGGRHPLDARAAPPGRAAPGPDVTDLAWRDLATEGGVRAWYGFTQ